VKITITAPIPTTNIVVFLRVDHNLGRTTIMFVSLKHRKSITISFLESWHGGNLKVNTYLDTYLG
jgi:hypothetical protein